MVDALLWDAATETFYVRYKNKQGVITAVCWYEGFDSSIFWEMYHAPSMGKFMWARLYHWRPQGKV